MDGPLLDLTNASVRRMIKLAKKRGYVTYEELDGVLPPDEFSPDQIEEVIGQLSEMGINLVESAEEVENPYRVLAQELRSFATGQRGQRRELLINAANALDAEAGGFWSQYHRRLWNQPEEPMYLVFDQQKGAEIAEHDPTGDWIGRDGERLTKVTHWRSLPLPP